MEITADFPEKLGFLFHPAPYKVARGGRGGAKSWGFARALLILGLQEKLRILCAREIQDSIRQSVHKLLEDQIDLMGFGSRYNVLRDEIRGANGTEFAFSGLSVHTVDTIKSFEGVDVVWVEEAQVVTKRSWDILIPTIRKENSEIWVSYNPDLETDDTHQRWTIHPPAGAVNVEINYRDNPWHNELQEAKRVHCQITDPDNYDNIWEGKCRPAVEGAIYFKQIQELEAQRRICNVPYDPMLKTHVIVDLGWTDDMSIVMVQKHSSEIRIIDYIEGSHLTLADYSEQLKDLRYNWGKLWLPHDGFSKDVKMGKSSADILKRLGWDVPQKMDIVQMSVEEGIRVTRLLFNRMYFDKAKTTDLIEHLKRYRRRMNKQTESAGSPLHDDHSHGADALRYMAINIDRMRNEDDDHRPLLRPFRPLDAVIGH